MDRNKNGSSINRIIEDTPLLSKKSTRENNRFQGLFKFLFWFFFILVVVGFVAGLLVLTYFIAVITINNSLDSLCIYSGVKGNKTIYFSELEVSYLHIISLGEILIKNSTNKNESRIEIMYKLKSEDELTYNYSKEEKSLMISSPGYIRGDNVCEGFNIIVYVYEIIDMKIDTHNTNVNIYGVETGDFEINFIQNKKNTFKRKQKFKISFLNAKRIDFTNKIEKGSGEISKTNANIVNITLENSAASIKYLYSNEIYFNSKNSKSTLYAMKVDDLWVKQENSEIDINCAMIQTFYPLALKNAHIILDNSNFYLHSCVTDGNYINIETNNSVLILEELRRKTIGGFADITFYDSNNNFITFEHLMWMTIKNYGSFLNNVFQLIQRYECFHKKRVLFDLKSDSNVYFSNEIEFISIDFEIDKNSHKKGIIERTQIEELLWGLDSQNSVINVSLTYQ